jgi:hypothetical protein
MTTRRPLRHAPWAVTGLLVLAVGARLVCGADVEDGFESGAPRWALAPSDTAPRLRQHALERDAAHRGAAGERLVIDAAAGTTLRLEMPIGPAAVIDELRAGAWIRANRPGARLALRVALPEFLSAKTGRPVEVLVPGTVSRQADRWESLAVEDVPRGLGRQLAALRAEHGPAGSLANAVATHLVLDLYGGPGRHDIDIDDVTVRGAVAVVTAAGGRDPLVTPAAFTSPAAGPAPAAASAPAPVLARGVLEVAGLPFFPRSLDHNGEPLDAIARLGFNCVRLPAPATADLLAEAQRAGLWVICPPPELPDVDIRDPESVPTFSGRWDRVIFWDMGVGLAEADAESLAERVRRVRTCDPRAGRAVIGGADSGLRSVSRHVDMLVARRTVLGTSLELLDYLAWLRERPRLARPGTPFLAALSTEIDPRAARQAAALAGIGGRGLAVDPESLTLASFAAAAAGSRGILFSSSHRIDGQDRESRARAAAALAMNLRLKLLEPWGAAGRFAAAAVSSDPEVQAVVMEAARARMVLVSRCVQGAQIVARQYHGDVPRQPQPLTLLVPGVPEAHQAWELAPGGLRPLKHKRVTGGISLSLDSFRAHALVLLSGEPAVTAHVQERVRELEPLELSSARGLAEIALADAATLLGRVPPTALGNLPAAAMLAEAREAALAAASAADAATAIEALRRAAAIGGQVERLAWERGVLATGSMVASPLSVSDATLPEHWRFIEALAATTPSAALLSGGDMERIEELAAGGWRHFALPQPAVRAGVEIDRTHAAEGKGCLVMRAVPASAEEQPVVVETPPVWVTTPAIRAPAGRLVEIRARVWVPEPIRGSVDGLLVFDSLGGPALAERVAATPAWRRLVLYRIVPADLADEPLTVTFALTGIGEARIDDVAVHVLERTGAAAGTLVAGPAPRDRGAGSFPAPSELLGGGGAAPPAETRPGASAAPTVAPPAAAAPQAAAAAAPAPSPQWPGMSLEWPSVLPFARPATAPPPGPGGGTIDPFKRARGQAGG